MSKKGTEERRLYSRYKMYWQRRTTGFPFLQECQCIRLTPVIHCATIGTSHSGGWSPRSRPSRASSSSIPFSPPLLYCNSLLFFLCFFFVFFLNLCFFCLPLSFSAYTCCTRTEEWRRSASYNCRELANLVHSSSFLFCFVFFVLSLARCRYTAGYRSKYNVHNGLLCSRD